MASTKGTAGFTLKTTKRVVMEFCQNHSDLSVALYGAGMVAYSALEYWLGKTDKVKAASLPELIGQGISALFRTLFLTPRRSS